MRLAFIILMIACFASPVNAQSRYLKKPNKYLLKSDTTNAMLALNKMIAKHPTEADLYMKRAELKMARKNFDAAMVDLNSYCGYNQVCGQAELLKGIIRYEQLDYRGAIEHLSAYSIRRDDEQVWNYLGMCHLKLKNYQIARNAFEKAFESNGKNQGALYNAGLASYLNEEYEMAIDFFNRSIELLPGDLNSWMGLGLAQTALHRFSDANKSFRQALAIDENNGTALYNIGVNYYGMNEKDEACVYWEKANQYRNLAAGQALEQYCQEKATKDQKK